MITGPYHNTGRRTTRQFAQPHQLAALGSAIALRPRGGVVRRSQASKPAFGPQQRFQRTVGSFDPIVQMLAIYVPDRVLRFAATVHFLDHFGITKGLVGDDSNGFVTAHCVNGLSDYGDDAHRVHTTKRCRVFIVD